MRLQSTAKEGLLDCKALKRSLEDVMFKTNKNEKISVQETEGFKQTSYAEPSSRCCEGDLRTALHTGLSLAAQFPQAASCSPIGSAKL